MKRLSLLFLGALTLFSPLFALEVQVRIPIDQLSLCEEGIFLLLEEGGVIRLSNLSHDEKGFFSTCEAFICSNCGAISTSPCCSCCGYQEAFPQDSLDDLESVEDLKQFVCLLIN